MDFLTGFGNDFGQRRLVDPGTGAVSGFATRESSSSKGSVRGEMAPAMNRMSPDVVGGTAPLYWREASRVAAIDSGSLSFSRTMQLA